MSLGLVAVAIGALLLAASEISAGNYLVGGIMHAGAIGAVLLTAWRIRHLRARPGRDGSLARSASVFPVVAIGGGVVALLIVAAALLSASND